MPTAGVDMGSLSTAAVICNENSIISREIVPTGADAEQAGKEALQQACQQAEAGVDALDKIVATGYGRVNLAAADEQITEITCHGIGAKKLYPEASTVIDIGGQDSKVIRLDNSGMVIDFEMNDKCAAGTGRFLEVMAEALEVELAELEVMSKKAEEEVNISSMCAVFAESEVVTRVAEGHEKDAIIKGIHRSIASRTAAMVGRIGLNEPVIMTGGVAKNTGVVNCLEDELDCEITVPEEPQIVGALGAALLAGNQKNKAVGGS